MESKIRVLSDHTINKIAAGEVIENPASVVKELIENSLDAGAQKVCIEIKEGGRQLIRITDDGSGMNPDDALLCLERHATSKIRAVEEINDISTMGFRGEAIPSIASISKFTLLTNPKRIEFSDHSVFGTMVIVDGGQIISCTPAACAQGTSIEVKNLFFNVPVRKKFLKSPSVDANEILKTVSMMSLGYPEIKFELISDGKILLPMPAVSGDSFAEQMQSRIAEVIGQDYLSNVEYFKAEKNGVIVEGVVGRPMYTRHNRSGQYLFINRRCVVSSLVLYAVKDGYGTALATGRHPVFVLHLTLPGSMVDVNVHPQKREVRLRQEQLIRDLIAKAVSSAFKSSNHFQRDFDFSPQLPEYPKEDSSFAIDQPSVSQEMEMNHRKSPEWVFQPKEQSIGLQLDRELEEARSWMSAQSFQPVSRSTDWKQEVRRTDCELPKNNVVPAVLATINRYILLDGSKASSLFSGETVPSGLILIDQRGAHTRILYEKLSRKELETPLATQMLLIPHSIEVSAFEADALRKALSLLNQMGIQIKEFGPRNFVIEAIPQMFGNSNLEVLVEDIIRDVRSSQNGQENEFLFARERAKQLSIAAGRSSVSRDQKLSIEEAQSLIDQLLLCQQPFQCPAGKSIISRLSSEDLSKLFSK